MGVDGEAPVRSEHGDTANGEGAGREEREVSTGREERSGLPFYRGRGEWERAPGRR